MNPLLISGFGTSISVDKRKLIINNLKMNEHLEFYPHQIDHDSIIIDGHTGNISFEAIRWLSKHNINVTVLNWNGNLLACINPKEPNNGKLRTKQYAKYSDDNARYEIACKIINEKVRQSHNLLKELSRYYQGIDIEAFEKAIDSEKPHYNPSDKRKVKDRLNALLQYEAKIAALYWEYLAKIFNQVYPEFNFQNRKNKSYSWNMNASDEINALLNYGYAILESQSRKSINSIGLDMSVGFLHETSAGKTPLVYDVQELERWLIDLSVIQLLEEKRLKKSDFITTENYHIRLKPDTAKMLIEKTRLNFDKKASYKDKNYTYENILTDNVQKLANHILDKNELKFDIPLTKIARNDELGIRDILANMTTEERKKLGINKSTLWYIQKNIREGKKIELYDKIMVKIV